MKTDYDMVVMGDINLDWCSRGTLSFPFSNLIVNGVIEWAPIDERPGGSGLNFARFAQEDGYRPLLLGKIGDDPAGDFIYEWLQQYGLESGVSKEISLGTGKAFIARDKNGIRFLVNNEPNVNQELSVSDVKQHANVIESCQVLYVSGYCLMYPEAPRSRATLKAMALARRGSQSHIVFDVVPHQFYKIYDFSKFRELTTSVDILISEVATMLRYLDKGYKGQPVTESMARKATEQLMKYYDRFILRYGPSGCDTQIVWDAQRQDLKWEETGHEKADDKRGFGDRLALRVLKDDFKIALKYSHDPTNK